MKGDYLYISSIGLNPSNLSKVKVEVRAKDGVTVKEFSKQGAGCGKLHTSDAAILIELFLSRGKLPKAIHYLCSKTGSDGDTKKGSCTKLQAQVDILLNDIKQCISEGDKRLEKLYSHLLQMQKANSIDIVGYSVEPRDLALDLLIGIWGGLLELAHEGELDSGAVVNVTRGPKSMTSVVHYVILSLQPLMEALGNKAELFIYYQHNIFKGKRSGLIHKVSDESADNGDSESRLYDFSFLLYILNFAEALKRFYKSLDIVDFIDAVRQLFESYEVDLLTPQGTEVLERCKMIFDIAPYSVYPYLLSRFMKVLRSPKILRLNYTDPRIRELAAVLRKIMFTVLSRWSLDTSEPYFGKRAMELRLSLLGHLAENGYIANALLLYREFVIDLLIHLYLKEQYSPDELRIFNPNMYTRRDDMGRPGDDENLRPTGNYKDLRSLVAGFLNSLASGNNGKQLDVPDRIIIRSTDHDLRIRGEDVLDVLQQVVDKYCIRDILKEWFSKFKEIRNTIAHGGNTLALYGVVFKKGIGPRCLFKKQTSLRVLTEVVPAFMGHLQQLKCRVLNS